jgi:hypothetical protein
MFAEALDMCGLVQLELVWLDQILLFIPTCKLCRVGSIQFGGSGAKIGRDSGCYIMNTHRATHRLLFCNSSPNNLTVRIWLRVTFDCSLLWKRASSGQISQPWWTSSRLESSISGWFEENHSLLIPTMTGSVQKWCVNKGSTLEVIG